MTVRLDGRRLEIRGRARFIQSADIQYFRLPRAAWEDRLSKAADGGMNTVTTYIPWFWHEPDEGRFDFRGETVPERDLLGFLDLVQRQGLFLVARPGPFINAEFNYGGHPPWLFERYPEVYSHRADGGRAYWEGYGVPVPSQLHPTFLRLVDAWYDRIIPPLAERTIHRGGPVILAQPDNEMNLVFTYGVHGSLYDDYVVGDGTREGLWHEWLRARFESLETVNARYGSHARAWAEIKPPGGHRAGSGGNGSPCAESPTSPDIRPPVGDRPGSASVTPPVGEMPGSRDVPPPGSDRPGSGENGPPSNDRPGSASLSPPDAAMRGSTTLTPPGADRSGWSNPAPPGAARPESTSLTPPGGNEPSSTKLTLSGGDTPGSGEAGSPGGVRPSSGEDRSPAGAWAGSADDRRTLDWLHFKRDFIFRYAARLIGRMRELGLDIPVFMNEPLNRSWVWSPGQHAAAAAYMRAHGIKDFFTAGHCYLYGGEQDFQGIGAAISHTAMVRSSGSPGPAVVIETAAAWWEVVAERVGERAPYNWDILMRVQLGCGIDGYNYYIYAGGRTPPGVGGARGGLWYDWAVPIGLDGSLRPAYHKTRALAQFVSGWEPEILATKPAADAVLGLFEDLPLLAKETNGEIALPMAGGPRRVAGLARDVYENTAELVTLLASLSISSYVNMLDYALSEPRQSSVYIVPNPGRLPRGGIDCILDHLRAGGRVVLLPAIPTATPDGEPDPRLAEVAHAELERVVPIRGAGPEDFRYKAVSGRTVDDAAVDRGIFIYRPKPGGPLDILATYDGQPCAFKQRALGGELIVCGAYPRYITEDSLALFRDILLDAPGLQRAAWSDDEALFVVQRETDERPEGPRLVVAANVRGSERPTYLHVRSHDGTLTFPRAAPLALPPKRARCLWVNLPLPAARLVYCTSEIVPAHGDRSCLLLRGEPGTSGEIAFDRAVRLTLDGEPCALVQGDGVWLATYEHRGASRTLILQHASH